MNLKSTRSFLLGLIAATALLGAFAGSAYAGPQWKFNEEALTGEETVVGAAESSSLTMPGLVTTCDNFLYEVNIANSGGTGAGGVEDIPLFGCHTNGVCTVEATEAFETPWPVHLTKVGTSNYIVIEEVREAIEYGNPACVLFETEVEIEGSAGGRIDNATESATFDASSFKETKTGLTAFGNVVEWKGVFPTEAFEWHREEALSVS